MNCHSTARATATDIQAVQYFIFTYAPSMQKCALEVHRPGLMVTIVTILLHLDLTEGAVHSMIYFYRS